MQNVAIRATMTPMSDRCCRPRCERRAFVRYKYKDIGPMSLCFDHLFVVRRYVRIYRKQEGGGE